MPFPLIPVLLGTGVVTLIALMSRKDQADPPPPDQGPPDNAKDEYVPRPVPPPAPTPFPPGLGTAVVSASKLRVRDVPDENTGRVVAELPRGATVAILDTTPEAPTAAAPLGWFNVLTNLGVQGYASAEWLEFGTAKERAMTPEEELEYHRREAERERAIYTSGTNIGAWPARYESPREAWERRRRARHQGGRGWGQTPVGRPPYAPFAVAPIVPSPFAPERVLRRPGVPIVPQPYYAPGRGGIVAARGFAPPAGSSFQDLYRGSRVRF